MASIMNPKLSENNIRVKISQHIYQLKLNLTSWKSCYLKKICRFFLKRNDFISITAWLKLGGLDYNWIIVLWDEIRYCKADVALLALSIMYCTRLSKVTRNMSNRLSN